MIREYWFILLPSALGFVAVYLLLPQVRRSRPAWAAALGGLSLVLSGILLGHRTGIAAETFLFYCFAAVAVVGGGLLVTQSNPVHAALSFALVVISSCGLFLLNEAPFLTAATIIIYAGAIVVTFLFVLMLAQQSGVDNADLRSREPLLASIAGFVLLASLLGVLYRTFDLRELDGLASDLERLSAAKTPDDVNRVLGPPPTKIGAMKVPLADKLRKYLPDDPDNERNYASKIEQAHNQQKIEVLSAEAMKALEALESLRGAGYGTVAPRGDKAKALPAKNVAKLGEALFTYYLVPVELAGVLLLVATIGAIAIAGRRSEVLR
jgi:NADH:ubiquinone oxidoreductase subunit 6 (subunit J)